MNFYDHHIGDYTTATIHLTLAQHGAYRRLMDIYYGTEKPISLDFDRVCKSIPTRNKEEENTVRWVLEEFFKMKDDGWHNAHCDKKIQQWRKNRENGGKSKGRPPLRLGKEHEKENPKHNPDDNPNKTQDKTQTKPSHLPLPISHIPLPNSHLPEPGDDTVSPPDGGSPQQPPKAEGFSLEKHEKQVIPFDEIVNEYNRICVSLRKCRKLSDVRKRDVAKIYRLLDHDMEQIRLLFTKAQNSAFCRGEKPNERHPNFQADFAWLMKEEKALRTLEGKYDDKNKYDGIDEFGEAKMEEQ